jgi:predicted ATPase
VHFIALAGVGSPALLASSIATALTMPPRGGGNILEQLLNYLEGRSMLLVLDNFEHLLDATDVLMRVLSRAPGVKILVTSRERLNLRDEWAVRVNGLAFPDTQVRGSIVGYPAVQLFVERAKHVQSSFSLSDHSDEVATICGCVEGMPLALELAATWLRVMSCEQIAQEITRGLEFLTAPLRDLPERHRSMRTVFDWSWNLLSEPEKHSLAALAVFRGGFDREAADRVADASLAMLATLADKSLIKVMSGGRYDLQQLIQQYLSERLVQLGRVDAVRRAHLECFAALSTRAEAELHGPDQQVWFDRMEIEADNVAAALSWSAEHAEAEDGLQLGAAMQFFWEQRNPLRLLDGCRWIEQLVSIHRGGSLAIRAKAIRCLAKVAWYWGDERQGQIRLEESLGLAREAGDEVEIAWALGDSGFWHGTDMPRKAAELEIALRIFREQGDAFGRSHMLRRLGWNLTTQGDYVHARPLLEEALSESRSSGDPHARAWSLYLLGNLLWLESDDPHPAERLYREALAVSDVIKDTVHRFLVLLMLAHALQARADFDRALDCYDQSIASMVDVGGVWWMWLSAQRVACLAAQAKSRGDLHQAAYLIGAAESVLKGQRLQTMPRADVDLANREVARELASIRTEMDEEAYARAFAAGRAKLPAAIIADLGYAPSLDLGR